MTLMAEDRKMFKSGRGRNLRSEVEKFLEGGGDEFASEYERRFNREYGYFRPLF